MLLRRNKGKVFSVVRRAKNLRAPLYGIAIRYGDFTRDSCTNSIQAVRYSLCMAVLLILGMSSPAIVFAERGVDTVTLVDGTTVRGNVLATTSDVVTVKTPDEEKKVETDKVSFIRFGGEPGPLVTLREQLRKGEWDAAKQSLGRLKEAPEDPMILREVEFYRAYAPALEALRTGSGHKEAARDLFRFAQQHKLQSHHYPETLKTLGALALQLRNFDVARKQFVELQTFTPPTYKLWGMLGEAEILEFQGAEKIPAAMAILDKASAVAAQGPSEERLKRIALARKWALQGASGKSPDAIAAIEKMIQEGDSKDSALFAELYNCLGSVHMAASLDEDALCDFLHVDLMYSGEREAHARALSQITLLFRKLSQPERSQDARKRLLAAYPGSPWTKQLAAE